MKDNRIAPDLLYQFELLYQNDCTAKTIVDATSISRATVFRLMRNMDFWGTPYPPAEQFKSSGRRKKLLNGHMKVVSRYCKGAEASLGSWVPESRPIPNEVVAHIRLQMD